MKKPLLLILSISPFCCSAQLVRGDELTLGRGSSNDGRFAYVLTKNFKSEGNYTNGAATVEYINVFHPPYLYGGIWVAVKIKGLRGNYKVNVDSGVKYGEIVAIDGHPAKGYIVNAADVIPAAENSDFNQDAPMSRLVNSIDEGCVLTLGVGTMPNGNFAFVKTIEISWLAIASAGPRGNDAVFNLGADYGGLKVTVKKTHEFGNHKFGFKKMAIVAGGNIVNYQVDLCDAIRSGEVVAVNGKEIDKNGDWGNEGNYKTTKPKNDDA